MLVLHNMTRAVSRDIKYSDYHKEGYAKSVDESRRIKIQLLQNRYKNSKLFDALQKIFPSIIFSLKDTSISRDRYGVEIWNRSANVVIERLFTDELNPNYQKYSANNDIEQPIVRSTVVSEAPICGLNDFFREGSNILDLGCGGGEAAIGFSKLNKNLRVVGVDHAFEDRIPIRKSYKPNLTFQKVDWNAMPFEDGSFDRIISDQGAGVYFSHIKTAKEITRISKIGCVFRGNVDKGVAGERTFTEELCDMGWDVYTFGNRGANFVAIYKGEDYAVSRMRLPRVNESFFMKPVGLIAQEDVANRRY